MSASFDENGPTVVGNKVMISGSSTLNVGTVTVDVSPYMNGIEQVIVNDTSSLFSAQFRNQADDANLAIRSQYFAQQLTDTTFKFVLTAIPDTATSTDASPTGLFIVIGRK